MEWDDLHKKAKAVVPDPELPPNRYWVGVLLHEKMLSGHLTDLDFIWMRAHSKISIAKIHSKYIERFPNINVELRFKDEILAPDIVVTSMNDYSDNIIILRAVEKEQAPLYPINRQTHIAPPSPTLPIKVEIDDATPTAPIAPKSGPHHAPTEFKSPSANKENTSASFWDLHAQARSPLELNDNTHMDFPQESFRQGPEADINSKTVAALYDTPPNVYHPLSRSSSRPSEFEPPASVPQQYVVPNSKPSTLINSTSHAVDSILQAEQSMTPSEQPQGSSIAFDLENVSTRGLTPTIDEEASNRYTDNFIRQIIGQRDPEILEAAVSQALKILDSLKRIFSTNANSSPEAHTWIRAIDKQIPQSERKRTVLGVMGNTGAGKSSVINAMLDEERLVPTNCMRACTAVVTEISWNHSIDPLRKYRAEIEFIGLDDWERDLNIFLNDLISENGTISRDSSDANSDAGIAWAKVHAVYPTITKEKLVNCDVATLMAEKSVLDVLGTTKKINRPTQKDFYTALQMYVDSKEKVTSKRMEKEQKNRAYEMEYWPLIKVVKIYVKSPTLSTGAVIVDLPGVHDSNAARAAIAQGYMKQCTGLWIVAPITRAVDDKAAKTLLGDSFRRQLKYDGGLSSITFICSKTDDISITEAADSLELDDEINRLDEQEQMHKQEVNDAQTKIKDLQECQAVYKAARDEASDEIDVWDDLKDRLEDGETVFAPRPRINKRKRGDSDTKARKRYQAVDNDSNEYDDDVVISEDGDDSTAKSNSDNEKIQISQKPLTMGEIKAKLEQLRQTRRGTTEQHLVIQKNIKEIKPQVAQIKSQIAEVRAEKNRICISGRNQYSKTAIQHDFAAGIKELDQELAAEVNEEDFNPEDDLRNYEEVARSLPVFCVSSRAYQKMCGRLLKDEDVPGFSAKEETEIPQLQAHCKKLTEAGRIQTGRAFLLSFCQQLTTFSLWASSNGSGIQLADDDKHKQVKFLERKLQELDTGLGEAIQACIGIMRKEMNDQIFDKYPDVIAEAIETAPKTAQGWGAPKLDGGLAWSTYKAIVRRDGQYRSATAGHRDFNAELVGPIMNRLATGWERAFQNRLPKAFTTYINDSGRLLHNFHQAVEERARQNGVGLASLAMLKTQICTYEQLFNDLANALITNMTELQRDANREFTPTIAHNMNSVYHLCTTEHGQGSFKRMKDHMKSHVDQKRHCMFKDATETVTKNLDAMCKNLRRLMEERADEIFVKMKADYMGVLGGVNASSAAALSQDKRAVRAEVINLLQGVDSHFESIAQGRIITEPDNDMESGAADETAMIEDNGESAFEEAVHSSDEY